MKKLLVVLFAFSLISCAMMTTNEASIFVYDKTGKPGTLSVTVDGQTKSIFGADEWTITWKSDTYTGKDAYKTVTVTAATESFSQTLIVSNGSVKSVDIY